MATTREVVDDARYGRLVVPQRTRSRIGPVASAVARYTVLVVLSTFLTAQTINLPALFAGAAIGAAPLVIVFLFLQRYIVQGVRMSSIKG